MIHRCCVGFFRTNPRPPRVGSTQALEPYARRWSFQHRSSRPFIAVLLTPNAALTCAGDGKSRALRAPREADQPAWAAGTARPNEPGNERSSGSGVRRVRFRTSPARPGWATVLSLSTPEWIDSYLREPSDRICCAPLFHKMAAGNAMQVDTAPCDALSGGQCRALRPSESLRQSPAGPPHRLRP